MKKILTLLFTVFLCFYANAQETITMQWDGQQRQYLKYVPDSYDPSTPTPVIFGFHGVGKTMDYFFEVSKFYNIADEHGWILICPQALDYRVLNLYNMGSTWNAGVSASIGLASDVLQENVDDPGLVFAILDDLIANYNIDEDAIFCTGVSMGGFMSNRMAIEHGDRIKAVASVNGTIGNELTSSTPVRHISTMHIHGTADDTITYSNAGFPLLGSHISLGLGAEATVEWWRNFNQCSETPVYTSYPDLMNDGKTYEKFLYEDGIDGTKTAFIKTTNGHHEWYSFPDNDIDYATEIYNFFASCIETPVVAEDSLPTVTTDAITDILTTTATGGGNVTSDGGAPVTARGVCWRTLPNPTLSYSHYTTDGSGTGSFTSALTNLTPNTTYYVRAYATNSVGTAYGAEVSFTTACDSMPLTISGDTVVEQGESTTLSVEDNPDWTYLWNTGDTTASITVTPEETTTYSVVVIYGQCESEASITVSVTITDTVPTDTVPTDTTGILHYETANLQIYPNPTSDIVTIELSPVPCTLNPEIQVFDIYGKRLQIISVSDERTQMDLSHYAPGIYIIKIVNSGKPVAIGKVAKK